MNIKKCDKILCDNIAEYTSFNNSFCNRHKSNIDVELNNKHNKINETIEYNKSLFKYLNNVNKNKSGNISMRRGLLSNKNCLDIILGKYIDKYYENRANVLFLTVLNPEFMRYKKYNTLENYFNAHKIYNADYKNDILDTTHIEYNKRLYKKGKSLVSIPERDNRSHIGYIYENKIYNPFEYRSIYYKIYKNTLLKSQSFISLCNIIKSGINISIIPSIYNLKNSTEAYNIYKNGNKDIGYEIYLMIILDECVKKIKSI